MEQALLSRNERRRLLCQKYSYDTARRLQEHDPSLTGLHIGDPSLYYRSEGFKVGWLSSDTSPQILGNLGLDIGMNVYLKTFKFDVHDEHDIIPSAGLTALASGLKVNCSIQELGIQGCDLSLGAGHEILNAFEENTTNLLRISLCRCDLGNGGSKVLSSVLRRCKNVEELCLTECGINGELLKEVISSIRGHSQLKMLDMRWNDISSVECEILASLLQEPSCRLAALNLDGNQINDDCCEKLARALGNNSVLETLHLPSRNAMTSVGWEVFSQALCDTSSINATFYSNHTLKYLQETLPASKQLNFSLIFNRNKNKSQVAMTKILRYHNHFDMTPFFEYDAKMLPYAVNWFDRAQASDDVRKLDVLYQFMHAMPGVCE